MRSAVRPIFAAVAVATLAATALGASAAPQPKVTGGISLGSPNQYVSFNAFQGTTTAATKGSVTYTNFDYATPGTGVWTLTSPVHIDFNIGGNDYNHTMTVTGVTPSSNNSLSYTATGVYDPDPSYTWNGSGTVSGSNVTLNLVYTGTSAGYALQLVGTIAPNGSMSGTETGSNTGTWSAAAGSAHEVLSYTSAVTCAVINGTAASFSFNAGGPFVGTPILVSVTDGGSPGSKDTYKEDVNGGPCATTSAATQYPITGGNLVVH